mgnify:CR=1 FL=1
MVNKSLIIIFLLAAITGFGAENDINYFPADTVNINSTGKQNQIVVDSVEITLNITDTLILPFTGQLMQTGQANQIEINTDPGKRKPDDSKSKITITQTGNNNKVKINSQ